MNDLVYPFAELLRRIENADTLQRMTNARRDVLYHSDDAMPDEQKRQLYGRLKRKAEKMNILWKQRTAQYVPGIERDENGMSSGDRFDFRQWVEKETGVHYCTTQGLWNGKLIDGKDLTHFLKLYNEREK